MTNNSGDPTEEIGDESTVNRRQVLAGVGGLVAMGAVVDPVAARRTPSDLTDVLADQLSGAETSSDREELAFLLEELEKDGERFGDHDFEELSPATRQEFAEKGRRLKNRMEPECGYEGYEIWLPINGCCEAHDICETYNDGADSVFNGDSCDGMFWTCATI